MKQRSFAVLREVIILVARTGVAATRAIDGRGLMEYHSNSDIVVLTALRQFGALRPRELLSTAHLTSGGLANLLDRLESAGLVVRTYGGVAGDRRGATVTLSAEGKRVTDRIVTAVTDALRPFGPELIALGAALDAQLVEPPAETPPSLASRVMWMGDVGNALGSALAAAAPDDPTPGKSTAALSCAAEPGGVRPMQLLDVLGLSSGGVSQLLDRLEHAGLVRRVHGVTSDKRAVTVELTDAGRSELRRRLAVVHEHLPAIRAAFVPMVVATTVEV